MASKLRIGYVPEHFSTPLYFAKKHFGLDATLIPFPSGTGHMVTSLQSSEIDIGIGLTEGWVNGLAKLKSDAKFKVIGSYVKTPLCWAISTGAKRDDVTVESLASGKIGISRFGSGSYVMSFVLADQKGWLKGKAPGEVPFEFKEEQTFEKLRKSVNDGSTDAFMWEHFTTKKYWDNGDIKRIGEIYTPWPSWKIVGLSSVDTKQKKDLLDKLNKGIEYFNAHHEEAVQYISTSLDYSAEDARAWLKTVKFEADATDPVVGDIQDTVKLLAKAGLIAPEEAESAHQDMIEPV